VNLLSFVFIFFFEMGLFNGLRRKKIKKSLTRLETRPGCRRPWTAPILTLVDAVAELSTIEIVITRIIALIFALRKKWSSIIELP
jgi:hypothetical protein